MAYDNKQSNTESKRRRRKCTHKQTHSPTWDDIKREKSRQTTIEWNDNENGQINNELESFWEAVAWLGKYYYILQQKVNVIYVQCRTVLFYCLQLF